MDGTLAPFYPPTRRQLSRQDHDDPDDSFRYRESAHPRDRRHPGNISAAIDTAAAIEADAGGPDHADDGVGRHGAPSGPQLPTRRSFTRRTRDHRDRRALATAHVLHGRGEWWPVSHHRRWPELGADHRWESPRRFDGLRRGLR